MLRRFFLTLAGVATLGAGCGERLDTALPSSASPEAGAAADASILDAADAADPGSARFCAQHPTASPSVCADFDDAERTFSEYGFSERRNQGVAAITTTDVLSPPRAVRLTIEKQRVAYASVALEHPVDDNRAFVEHAIKLRALPTDATTLELTAIFAQDGRIALMADCPGAGAACRTYVVWDVIDPSNGPVPVGKKEVTLPLDRWSRIRIEGTMGPAGSVLVRVDGATVVDEKTAQTAFTPELPNIKLSVGLLSTVMLETAVDLLIDDVLIGPRD